MHSFVSFNGTLTRNDQALIRAISSAAMYGKGIFTTLAIYQGRPFLWEKHWRRLRIAAEKLTLDISKYREANVQKFLDEVIEINRVTSGRARITFFDESLRQAESPRNSTLLISTADRHQIPSGFRLTLSPYRINSASPLAGIKTCNYVGKIIALEEAKQLGFDEAIEVNERGDIASACMANMFWVKNSELYTPTLDTGCLAGTTREYVMEKLDCREIEASPEVLQSADAIFLTSAGLGVVPVSDYKGRKLDKTDHEILRVVDDR